MQGGLFSAMIGTSGYLVLRKRHVESGLCNFDFVCRNCKKNSHCQLPEASKYRMNKRKIK